MVSQMVKPELVIVVQTCKDVCGTTLELDTQITKGQDIQLQLLMDTECLDILLMEVV